MLEIAKEILIADGSDIIVLTFELVVVENLVPDCDVELDTHVGNLVEIASESGLGQEVGGDLVEGRLRPWLGPHQISAADQTRVVLEPSPDVLPYR